MHNRIIFNFGEFKSRKCSISFSRDYANQGQENKKALKIKVFRGYIFFIAIVWLGWRDSNSCILKSNNYLNPHLVLCKILRSIAKNSGCPLFFYATVQISPYTFITKKDIFGECLRDLNLTKQFLL